MIFIICTIPDETALMNVFPPILHLAGTITQIFKNQIHTIKISIIKDNNPVKY